MFASKWSKKCCHRWSINPCLTICLDMEGQYEAVNSRATLHIQTSNASQRSARVITDEVVVG